RRQKRQTREASVARVPEQGTEMEVPTDDLLALLDEEVNRLPEKYRAAVILCELQGRPRREAAQTLKIAEGTRSSRLTTARATRPERLGRRGVVLSTGAYAAALSSSAATASVSGPLILSTLNAATAMVSGGKAAGIVSAKVLTLKDGVLKAMFL